MQSFKYNFLQKTFLSITALMFLSCGSFSPSSFISSDGIYQSQEVVSETNNGEFYKNYFKEKEIELESNYELISESLDSDFISSSDIAYTENNARWGDIPDTKTLVFDFSRTYYNRYFGYGYGFRPHMFGFGYYDYWNPYYSPWYSYSYWNPYRFYGRYGAWGYNPWIYYGWGYNRWGYNRWGYSNYNNSYENRSYTNRKIQDVSYSKGRRGSSSGVIVYSSGRSSRMDDLISTENEEKIYNGRSVKSFDILVERDNGDIDKVRTYQTKPGSDDLIDKRSANDSQKGAKIYLNRGSRFSDSNSSSRNYNQDASTLSNDRRYYVNPNSTSNSNRRYYANPSYNNAGWRLSGKGGSSNINRSSNSGTSTRSYSSPSSSSNNRSISTQSRNFSSSSISSPTRGSSSGSSSIGRGSSSSSGSSRGGGPR